MSSLAACRCPFRLMRRCFLGRWICLLVSEGFRLVWWCRLFDNSTYIPFCVHWHGDQCLRPFIHLSIGFWLYTVLLCRSSMSSNCMVFHTSGGISSSPAAFLFLIFLRTESSSSWVNGPSLTSNCLLIILVIGSCVTFAGFSSRFSKCCFHSFILSCWFAAFSFSLIVLLHLLTSFIVC